MQSYEQNLKGKGCRKGGGVMLFIYLFIYSHSLKLIELLPGTNN